MWRDLPRLEDGRPARMGGLRAVDLSHFDAWESPLVLHLDGGFVDYPVNPIVDV